MSNSLGTDKKIENIIRQHANMIYRIAYQNLKTQADAEDVFQDVCVALITQNAPLDDNVYIKNWLIRVTINKCNNFYKSVWRKRTEPIDNYIHLAEPEHKRVMEEIWQLPIPYRNVIYLYYYESYTIAEIAEIMGKKQNTISSQLQRARKKLKGILTDGGGYSD